MISAFIGAYIETAETMRRIERSEERARAEEYQAVCGAEAQGKEKEVSGNE